MQPDEPTVIATYFDVREAEFALSVLQGSGIEAYIDQPYTGSIAPYLTLGTTNVRLLVRQEDAERALAVLAEPEEAETDGGA